MEAWWNDIGDAIEEYNSYKDMEREDAQMQGKVIHELLRDLVGTAKANGNTDEIVAEIEKRVAEKEQQISRMVKLLHETNIALDESNQLLDKIIATMD